MPHGMGGGTGPAVAGVLPGGPTAGDDRDAPRRLAERLPPFIALFVGCIGLADGIEVTLHPERAAPLGAAFAIQLIACGLVLAALRVPALARRAEALATLLVATCAVTINLYNGVIGSWAERLAMAQICLLGSLPALLPWSWRAQAVVSAVSLATFTWVLPWMRSSDDAFWAALGLAIGAITSTVGARFLERYRRGWADQTARLAEEADIAATLQHVTELLSASHAAPDLLERVCAVAVRAIGCDWCDTWTRDESRRAFRLTASVGLPEPQLGELAELELDDHAMPLNLALRPGVLIEVENHRTDPRMPVGLVDRFGATSGLYAPITRGRDVIGVLGCKYRGRTGPFTPRQRRVALGVAQATAVALENVRLIAGLQEADRLKSEFVATMSHELRTPINVILGYAEILQDEGFGPLTDEQRDAIRRTRRSAVELLELVTATLDVNRLEAGRELVEPSVFAVEALMDELADELRPLVPAAVTLHCDATGAAGHVVTDRLKLRTILKNLAGNALKFTDRGEVAVHVAWDGDVLACTVRDTGMGIPVERLPVIFDMFRQLDGSNTRRHGGVGLGLYIVRRLVDLLGGSVAVDSAPGRGSTFQVRIPVERGAPRVLAATG